MLRVSWFCPWFCDN